MVERSGVITVADGAVCGHAGRVGSELPERLSTDATKRALYGADIDFLDGWRSATALALPDGWTDETALALLKPDAFVRGVGSDLLDFLQDAGFDVLAMQAVQLTEALVRTLWRYQWNMATAERRSATVEYMCLSPCLVMALRLPGDGSAARRLAALKGSADPRQRTTDSLRTRFAATDLVVNLIHTADEPADVVREVRLLLGEAGAEDFLTRLGAALDPAVDARRRDAAQLRRCTDVDPDALAPAWAQVLGRTRALDANVPGLQRLIAT